KAHEEVIKIRGGADEKRTFYTSRHGPLLETVATQAPAGHRFAMQWTGHWPGRDLDSLVTLWTAESLEECARGLEHHVCPSFNITYAGADGRIAYVLAGAIPKRRRGTPLRPLEGWTGAWDWQGEVPRHQNPRIIDPAQGFVVTANNPV